MSRTKPPQMQVGDAVAIDLKPLPDQSQTPAARHRIEQHRGRRFDQAKGPDRNDAKADEARYRVEPYPAEIGTGGKRGDGKHGSKCVGKDVNIGRAKIMVSMVVMVGRIMTV